MGCLSMLKSRLFYWSFVVSVILHNRNCIYGCELRCNAHMLNRNDFLCVHQMDNFVNVLTSEGNHDIERCDHDHGNFGDILDLHFRVYISLYLNKICSFLNRYLKCSGFVFCVVHYYTVHGTMWVAY